MGLGKGRSGRGKKRDVSTDLQLCTSSSSSHVDQQGDQEQVNHECTTTTATNSTTLFVKVYMQGIPIGRKLDLLALDGYNHLITTLHLMFHTTILWGDLDFCNNMEQMHILTYEDREGDWLVVGDVPWEMFLSAVRRLKISRLDNPN